MIICSKGITHGPYYIPPFSFSEGEVVVLYLGNGAHFHELANHVGNIFSGRITDENVTVLQAATFVPWPYKGMIWRLDDFRHACSKTKILVFSMSGVVQPHEAGFIAMAKTFIQRGGSLIILENASGLQPHFPKYVEAGVTQSLYEDKNPGMQPGFLRLINKSDK